jgi:hypothetical protein
VQPFGGRALLIAGTVFTGVKEEHVDTGMSERDDWEREFDLKWADSAEHREPSARARMLAARWRENPPGPVPFLTGPDPVAPRRSWRATAVVLVCVAALIFVLGYAGTGGTGY